MGDSDTVVTQMGYSPAGYPSTGYTDVASAEGVASEVGPAGEALTTTEGSEAVEPNQAGGYDSSVNGTVVENGEAGLDSVAGAVVEQQYVDGSALSAEEERLWNTVKANSSDFSAWTALIEETEKLAESNILKIRKVYDSFLAEFPLCYGYWKKYADHEAQLGSIDKVVEVYERAVLGVTYSVDIWLHYCIFAINTYGGDPDTIRRFFERGLAYVGTDYLSFSLWDKYIEYEYLQQEWVRLAMIYTRILENPNQQLDRYFNRVKAMMTVYGNDDSFKDLAGSRPLSELRTPEEAAAVVVASAESGNQENGEKVPSDSADESHKPVSAGLTEAEELEKYIGVREEMYKKAKEFDSKIIGFETAIRRPYFHVRPLSVAELENWHNYLDFIEREGDLNKVVNLYERSLIACASYHDYWIRYVLCMEASERLDLANNALARATQVFVKKQPEIHLFAARFKEQNGDIPGARAAYQLVHSEITPGLLEGIIKHANMEHRLGNLDDGFSLYEQAISIEKGKEHSQTLPMLFAQYSRFTHLVCGNPEKAREILVDAIEHVQVSKPLLEALIHFESTQARPRKIDFLDSLVVKFVEPNSEHLNVSLGEREELSSIFLEFLNLFGDVQSIKKATDRHAKLFLPHRSSPELKKRHAEDYLTSDKTKLARSYGVAPQAQSMVGAYPNVQNQWPAGYGTQSQAWPPASQTPGQQWTPGGYTQPASYGATAYAGYASGAPQSTTAYAGYPPTYTATAQTYPPQSYAQATAATTPQVPAQQPASATQAYYGNYY